MKRRSFLKTTGAAGAAIALAPYIAKGGKLFDVIPNEKILSEIAADNIMIVFELFGGNDGLNTIPPLHQFDEYARLRPQLRLTPEQSRQFGSSELFMHPALVDNVHNGGLMRLMENGQLAVVQGVGYDNANLSHFRSQEIWLSGINTSNSKQKLLEGWVGRFFAGRLSDYPNTIPEHPIALQIGTNLSLMFKSAKGDMGSVLIDPDKFYLGGVGLSPKFSAFATPYENYYQKEHNHIQIMARQSELYSQAVKAAYDAGKDKIKVTYTDGLSQKLRLISQLIAGGLKTQVYYVNLSNFDSHAQQSNADLSGQHTLLLNQVARALSEFMDDAKQLGFADRIAGFTSSEFGRRAYENASRGTDHGAGSMQFVFAGNDAFINGGYFRENGKPDLFDLDEFGNIKHQYDYRRTYSDFLVNWFGATQSEVTTVFGEYYFPMEVLNARSSSVREPLGEIEGSSLLVYPNPTKGKAKVKFELKEYSRVNIEIFDLTGIKVAEVINSALDAGVYEFGFNIKTKGSYICALKAGGRSYSQKFIVE